MLSKKEKRAKVDFRIMSILQRKRLRNELLIIFVLISSIAAILGVLAYFDATRGVVGTWAAQLYNVVVRS